MITYLLVLACIVGTALAAVVIVAVLAAIVELLDL